MNNEIENEIERINNRIQEFRNEKAKLTPENMNNVVGINYQIEELQKELEINKRALRIYQQEMLKNQKQAPKEVGNVVFYNFQGENGLQRQACIFYKDGSVQNTNVEGGEDALNEIISEEVRKVGKDSELVLESLVNNRYYNLSGEEFEERFQEFIYKEPVKEAEEEEEEHTEENIGDNDEDDDKKESTELAIVPDKSTELAIIDPIAKEIEELGKKISEAADQKKNNESKGTEPTSDDGKQKLPVAPGYEDEPTNDDGNKSKPAKPVTPVVPVKPVNPEKPGKDTEPTNDDGNKNKPAKPVTPVVPVVPVKPVNPEKPEKGAEPTNDDGNKSKPAKPVTPVVPVKPVNPEKPEKGAEPTNDAGNKSKPAFAVTPTPNHAGTGKPNDSADKNKGKSKKDSDSKNKKEGLLKRIWKKLVAIALAISLFVTGCVYGKKTDHDKGNNQTNKPGTSQSPTDNTVSNEYQHMLNSTENALQYIIMKHQGDIIFGFNRDFANHYVEKGKDIKAGLTWDEAVALNIGLNEYTPEQLGILLNGTVLSTKDIKDDFKNAQLQIIGAYVISDRDHPVRLASFLKNAEDKAIVQQAENKYYDFLEASEENKDAKEKELYEYLDKYLLKKDETLQPGMSHAELRDQHDSVDVSLVLIREATRLVSDNEHNVDLASGLCNIAYSKLEEAAILSQNHQLDTELELHEDYKEAAIKDLTSTKDYPLNDASRDLSQLDKFKERVNQGGFSVHTITTAHTSTVTKQETTVTDDRDTAVDKSSEEDVKEAEDEADRRLEEENKKAQEEAEKKAQEEADRLQQQADKEAQQQQQEVEQSEEDLQENIDDVNKGDKPATEENLGHGTEFDPEDLKPGTDDTLGDDIKDITTDGTGAVDENTPLPDPNEYASQNESTSAATYEGEAVAGSDQNIFEEEEEYTEETGKVYVKTR